MFQLQIRVLAQNDIQEIVDYYETKTSKRITDCFLDNLYVELQFIKTKPTSFQLKHKDTRVRYIKSFPFGIHYRIKNKNIIEILAVLHTSRNPNIWKNR